jgi:GNAT superfamily N-acetyltransferase
VQPDAISLFAEEAEAELPEPWLPGRRLHRSAFTLSLSPSPQVSNVVRVRTTEDELDATIDEVRGLLRAHGYTGCAWYLGPSCRPLGVARLLEERGFVPAARPPFEPRFAAMTLRRPPPLPAPAPGVEARLVRSADEYVRALRAGLVANGQGEDAIADVLAAAPGGWDHPAGVARMTHVALVDGEVAGVGLASYGPDAVLLAGGAVLPAFRGRGVYRALLASRWRAAVEMGKPALVVQAGVMSRPILERCGFETVCQLELLDDTGI